MSNPFRGFLVCKTCIHFKEAEEKEFKGLGDCNSDDANEHRVIGQADHVLFSENYGCRFHEVQRLNIWESLT